MKSNIKEQPQQHASTRVALNTVILYVRILISMGISLYSVRLVLNALGVADFGLFNLVTGVIAMFGFLNGAMTVSTQRYLSFHQGTGNIEMQKKVFSNSWVLHIIIGLTVVVVLLALTPVLFNGLLNIPVERIPIAKSIYCFLVVSVFFTIIATPFTASLNAHENMLWVAIVLIIESLLKLLVAFLLTGFAEANRLFFYGLFMAGITMVSFVLYAAFCLKKYRECRIRSFIIDKSLIKELGSFAGWNIFGNVTYVVSNQGINILLNLFFGVVVNAAYGIANQVNGQIKNLTLTLMQALNPQIMKSEGMNDRQRMLRISMLASKLGFFLVAIFIIPIIFEMSLILKIWLKNVPDNTAIFCSILLITTLITQLTVGISSVIQAIGSIKNYQLAMGSGALFTLPICYILLKFGMTATSVFVTSAVIEFVLGYFKIYILHKKTGMSIGEYLSMAIKMVISVCLICILVYLGTNWIHSNIRIVLTFAISFIVFPIFYYYIVLESLEKKQIVALIQKIQSRFISTNINRYEKH